MDRNKRRWRAVGSMASVVGFIVGISFASAAVEGAATESTLIVCDWFGNLVEISVPNDQTGPAVPVATTLVGWMPLGSAFNEDGRIFSVGLDNRLETYSPESGVVEHLCTIPISVGFDCDLAFDPAGGLLLSISDSAETRLYSLDSVTCDIEELGTVALRRIVSLEYHLGQFYLSGNGVYRVDPTTLSVVEVVPYSLFDTFWGLASDGTNLWYGRTDDTGSGGPTHTRIGLLNPGSGDPVWETYIPNVNYMDDFTVLEVIRQRATPIPALTPIGMVTLIILLGGFGAWILASSRQGV